MVVYKIVQNDALLWCNKLMSYLNLILPDDSKHLYIQWNSEIFLSAGGNILPVNLLTDQMICAS